MEEKKAIYILGIESSCDDTSAAVLRNGVLLSNVTASQDVHKAYGGVVPELASRAHQQNIVPVVDQAIKRAGITKEMLSAIAYTRGPGLMGSKVMGLGYPGGPIIDRLARQGNPLAYKFAEPHIPGFDYSFSGLKTSFLYSLRDWIKEDPDFIEHHKNDLAASLEHTIVDILMNKLRKAVKETGIKHVAVAGGVSANNGLRNAFREHADKYGWTIYIPKFSYTTDNAAMIAIVGQSKYMDHDFGRIDAPAFSKVTFK